MSNNNSITINAPGKINLTLDVLGKRSDGYHDLKMIMQTIDIHDELIISLNSSGAINLTMNKELPDKIPPEKNLVYKAAKLMKETYSLSNGFSIHLTKNIPAAAGLAGGSSDCAATLLGINKLCKLGLTKEELSEIGVKLGADVPFCIHKGTMLSEGIGDILTALPPLAPTWTVLIKPNISVSTGFVYKNLILQKIYNHPDTQNVIKAIKKNDLITLSQNLSNVLETVTIPNYPIISELKEFLLRNGAYGSLMSGSGPTVYGLYSDKTIAKIAYESARQKYSKYDIILCQTKIPEIC